jgi:hypothetical protein
MSGRARARCRRAGYSCGQGLRAARCHAARWTARVCASELRGLPSAGLGPRKGCQAHGPGQPNRAGPTLLEHRPSLDGQGDVVASRRPALRAVRAGEAEEACASTHPTPAGPTGQPRARNVCAAKRGPANTPTTANTGRSNSGLIRTPGPTHAVERACCSGIRPQGDAHSVHGIPPSRLRAPAPARARRCNSSPGGGGLVSRKWRLAGGPVRGT